MRTIVSRVSGSHYLQLQRRTYLRCKKFCPQAKLQFDTLHPDPWDYREKLWALRLAINRGARYVLWMDVSFEPIASLEPLWGIIEREGWYVPRQGDSTLRNWVSDSALAAFGIDREKADEIPLCLSGLVGIDCHQHRGQSLLNIWETLADTFAGAHQNATGQYQLEPWGNKFTGHVSDDPTVQGHRHDESALSFVLWKMGLTPDAHGLVNIDKREGEGFVIGRNFQRENGTYVAE